MELSITLKAISFNFDEMINHNIPPLDDLLQKYYELRDWDAEGRLK